MSGWRLLRPLLAVCWLAASLAAQARTVEGVVSHVTDGDSLWVRPAAGAPAIEVRLQGIDAPEICQPFGPQAREALASRVLHRRVVVRTRARDGYQRTLGQVSLNGQDIGEWMVGNGYAWSYQYKRRRGAYSEQQSQARAARLGLWAGAAMEPRQFRKSHGSCKKPKP